MSTRNRKHLMGWLALGCVLAPCAGAGAQSSAEILWDSWGVPHIYAAQREQALYAFGWAQMRAHGDAIARAYAAARGRLAEQLGEAAFEEDALVSQLRVPERAREALAAQDPAARRGLEAFARGLNDYAHRTPGAIQPQLRAVLPFTAEDVLAHSLRLLLARFLLSDAGSIEDYVQAQAPDGEQARLGGSNGYAIAPARSASGRALLVINPHLPWSGDLALFEAQLNVGGQYIYGASLVGQPYVSMGFSRVLGWTHTINAFDALDTYELELRGGGYVFDGQQRAFDALPDARVGVRGANGKLTWRSVPRRASLHGPVVFYDAARGKALALRFSTGEAAQLAQRYWQLAEAGSLQQFEAISNRYRLPCFNTLYADRAGHVLFRYEGVVPRRNGGDYASWQGIQPGGSSRALWTEFYGLDALPRVLDPARGFVQNANDPPWYASLPPMAASAYPPYIAPPQLDFRAQESLRKVAGEQPIAFETLAAGEQDNRVTLADRVLPELLSAASREPALEPARRVLAGWDRTLARDARGAVLFLAWVEAMGGADGDWFAIPWRAAEPLATPRGLADAQRARTVLREVSAQLLKLYGRIDPRYGDVYRLRLAGRDYPASTGPVRYGVYSAAEFKPAAGGKQVAWGGDSFIAVVELGDSVRAAGLLTYGNASQPGNRFRGDQLELFSKRRLRALWLERGEVEAHLWLREILSPP